MPQPELPISDNKRNRSPCRCRAFSHTTAVFSVFALAISVVRLRLHCIRAALPAICAAGTLLELQLQRWKTKPLATPGRSQLVALAGAWGLAAFCDCTVASDYWLAPTILSQAPEALFFVLACASFIVSVAAAILCSLFSCTHAPPCWEPAAVSEDGDERAPLVVSNSADVRNPLAASTPLKPDTPPLGIGFSCPHKQTFPATASAVKIHHQHSQHAACFRCFAEACGVGFGGLPTVASCSGRYPTDLLGACSGIAVSDLFDELPHSDPLEDKCDIDSDKRGSRWSGKGCCKDSAFLPVQNRDGGVLAGLAALEVGRAALLSKEQQQLPQQNTIPVVGAQAFSRACHRPYAASAAEISEEAFTFQYLRADDQENKEGSPLSTSSSVSTTASLDFVPLGWEDDRDRDEGNWWPPRSISSSPLLPECTDKKNDAEIERVSSSTSDIWEGQRGNCLLPPQTIQSTASPNPSPCCPPPRWPVVPEGRWKPYFLRLGFHSPSGCKRDSKGRITKRVGDLSWLQKCDKDATKLFLRLQFLSLPRTTM
ncbi:hypothetical protein cyc_00777 [Cyclospora cayetanensis]|uniref:Transmembrane protein n=1 Tax=Cyclospora cayetanensis TaxID=88456 RepID=A0A1D3CV24_9EIME|nr:hypothetical protein cyc_00777 [Cyclospora cayetanensis]